MKYLAILLFTSLLASCHKCYQCQVYVSAQQIDELKICTGDANYDKAHKGEYPYNNCKLVE